MQEVQPGLLGEPRRLAEPEPEPLLEPLREPGRPREGTAERASRPAQPRREEDELGLLVEPEPLQAPGRPGGGQAASESKRARQRHEDAKEPRHLTQPNRVTRQRREEEPAELGQLVAERAESANGADSTRPAKTNDLLPSGISAQRSPTERRSAP